jgi:hypothetical protein
VVDCLFEGTNTLVDGGAIYVSSAINLYATATSFIRCYVKYYWELGDWFQVITYPAFGGAISHDGKSAEILRCCFRECTSDDWGNAMSFWCTGPFSVMDCSFVACRHHDETSSGGIFIEGQGDISISISMIRLNFSDCVLLFDEYDYPNYGAVLFSGDDTGPWTFSECTVVRCGGGSGLDYQGNEEGRVELSNFYNNSCSSSDGLLSGYYRGFDVDRCIFSRNTPELYIYQVGSRPMDHRFSLTNCVFSGQLPAEKFCRQRVNNSPNMQTASLHYVYFATTACPNQVYFAPTPGATSEQTAEATAEETPEATSRQTSEATMEQTPEQTTQVTTEQTQEATGEEPSEMTAERATEQSAEVTPEQTQERTPEATTEQTSERTSEQSAEVTPERTTEQTAGASTEQTSEQTPEATAEQTQEARTEQPSQHTAEATTERASPGTISEASLADSPELSHTAALPSTTATASTRASSSAVLPPCTKSVSATTTESHEPSPGPSSTPSSSLRMGSVAQKGNLLVVVGSLAGVLVVVIGIIFVVFKVSRQKSSVTPYSGTELAVPECLESAMSGNDWASFLGGETENPIAPTMDVNMFAYTQDEGDF